MKTKLLLMLLALGLVASTAQTNVLKNPSFEEGTFTGNNLTPDYWEHYYTTYEPIHTWLDNPAEAHSGSKYMKMSMWSWGPTAWLMQTVNVIPDQEYVFSVWAKCPVTSEISEAWAWCEYLDTANAVISSSWLPWGWDVDSNWTYAEFGSVTTPELANRVIFSLAAVPENGVMGILYDDACIGTPLPNLPFPAWESLVPVGDVDLSWTNLTPNAPATSTYVDVLFGTEPNETDPVYNMVPLLLDPGSGQDVTLATVEGLDPNTYYWRVDSYLYGDPAVEDYDINGTDPNYLPVIKGYAWSFDIVSDAPPSSVDAGVDMITWSGKPVDSDLTVVDDGQSPLAIAWSAAASTGGVTSLVFSDPNIEDPTVTIIKDDYSAAMITNASFENRLTGWDKIGVGGTWDGEWAQWVYVTPTDGDWCAWLEGAYGGPDDPNEGSWISQTLTETLAAETTYTLEVDVVNDAYYMENVEYKIQLLAGETIIAEDDDSYPLELGDQQTASEWQTSTVVFALGGPSDPNSAYIGQPFEIRLVTKFDIGEMSFDNVHLTADPPFPNPDFSTVELTVRASDETNPTYVLKDSITVDVYSDSCAAAIAAEAYPADLDENCVIDPKDLYLMVENWLDSTELTAPEAKGLEQGDVVGNAGFEDPPLFSGQSSSTCLNSPSAYHWTKIGGWAGVWDPGPQSWSGYDDETPEGENCAFLEGGSGITQVLTETLRAETDYTLSVQVGNNYDYHGGFYTIELLAGETSLISYSEDVEDDIKNDTFDIRTLVYEHNPEDANLIGEPLEITISLLLSSNWVEVDFDDVRLEFECAHPNFPDVDAGVDMITWSGQEVQLDPTVVNNDAQDPNRPLTYAWTAEPDTGVVFSPSATVEAPTVTITKATINPSAVKLTLAVTLEGEGTMEDSMIIDVSDDACKAATGAGYEYAVTDFNGNCITGLGDFAILAETWLVDYDTLTGPAEKPE